MTGRVVIATNGELPGGVDVLRFPTPAFVVNLAALEKNLQVLADVQNKTGAKIILALKGFAFFPAAALVRKYLHGTTASGLHELILGAKEFGGERHVYSPSFDERSFPEITSYADHIIFNSPQQWQRFRGQVAAAGRRIECGIRVNPEYSEVEVPLYNPCYARSRLGTTKANFHTDLLSGITGLHFHTMCEQGSDVLERTVAKVEEKFGDFIKQQCRWVNFGGGHHITRPGYDIDKLCRVIDGVRNKFGVDVYLEPGEAIGLNCGVLVAQVLDVIRNDIDIAILDTSASTHMPDVLEMPYRPTIVGAGNPGELPYTYRLGGLTCLAGDVIGDYSFEAPLEPGTRLVFLDMAHYSMVKTTTFNGVKLPAICSFDPRTNEAKVIREFGYEDYRGRLG